MGLQQCFLLRIWGAVGQSELQVISSSDISSDSRRRKTPCLHGSTNQRRFDAAKIAALHLSNFVPGAIRGLPFPGVSTHEQKYALWAEVWNVLR